MYVLLLILLLALLMISYIIFNREVLCPPVILVAIFFICAVFGLFRYSDWALGEFSGQSVGLIITGLSSFIFFSFITYKTTFRRKSCHIYGKIDNQRIEVGTLMIFVMLLIGLLADYLFLRFMKTVTASFGVGEDGFTSLVLSYYQIKSYHPDSAALTGIVRVFSILANLNAVIALYVFLYNIIMKKFKMRDLTLMAIVMLWIIHSLFNSSRGEMMLLLAEAAYLLYFFWNIYYGWRDSVNAKIVLWGIRAFVIMITVFLILTVALGRRDSWGNLDVTKYLSVYVSGGIRNFDMFVNNYIHSDIFGKETFYSINRFLYNRFGIGEFYTNVLEFVDVNGVRNGNTYTALRRFYADFGIAGVIILPGSLGLFFTSLFKSIKKECKTGVISFRLILYSYLCSELFFFPIEERFFTNDFSVSGIVKLIILYFLFKFIVEKSIVIKTHWKKVSNRI